VESINSSTLPAGKYYAKITGAQNAIQMYELSVNSKAGTPVVLINEVDSDTAGTDVLEFVELFGAPNASLDGLTLVFYDGATDQSYRAIDLDGHTLDGTGYFVIGNSGVANVDLVFSNDQLQNGADAVALYTANAVDFPNGTAVTTVNLIDAVVYDTDDADDTGLLTLLNMGQPQVNENGNGNSEGHSLQRIANGSGGARNTNSFLAASPTPGAVNIALGAISGTVWDDANENGVQDGMEPGLPGWTVYLDLNNNDALDTGGAIEPDNFSNGTILTTIAPGVTLSAVGTASSDPVVRALNSSPTSTGARGFGTNGDGVIWTDLSRRLRIDFADPVSQVSIDYISDDSLDIGRLQVFDSQGNILGESITGDLTSGQSETMIVLTGQANIAYAIAGGFDGQFGRLDNLQFGVAEPSTVSDANGDYTFTGLPAGDYVVRQVPQAGWRQTAPEPASSKSTILITELNLGSPDFIEIQNVSGNTVDTTGWTVVASEDPYTNINTVNATTWTLPSSMNAGEVAYRTDNTGDNYWGSNLFFNPGNTGWVMILDDQGAVVDWVGWGWTTGEIASFNVTVGATTINDLSGVWTGAAVDSNDTTGGTGSLQRVGSSDSNSAADFQWVSPQSKGTANAGLNTPFSLQDGSQLAKDLSTPQGFDLADVAGASDLEFTNTEVIVSFQGAHPQDVLTESVREQNPLFDASIDLGGSYTLLTTEGGETLAVFTLNAGADPLEVIEQLSGLASVHWAAPNYIYAVSDPRELIPNDPDYGNQYHHPVMQNQLAWDITLGDSGVIIAVTDDGVDWDHVDLAANIWNNPGEIPGNGIDDDSNGYIDDVRGWDFIDNDNNPDHNGTDSHGTHVSGISAGRTNNSTGIAGTAGGSTIMPLKFYDGAQPGTWTSVVIAATYTYAVNNGAQIINTSYNVNGYANDPTYIAALQNVYDNGVLHFNSAGNATELNPIRQIRDQSIYVSSTDSADLLSGFTNYGTGIDVAAPGSSIQSTLPGNTYGLSSGTSMATPNAAGVAALIWSAHPTWTRDQVAAQLIGTADNIDALNPGFEKLLGSGRVNSFRGVTEVLAAPRIEGLEGLPASGAATNRLITSFFVDLDNVFNAASVQNSSNWLLTEAGADGTLGTGDDVSVPITLQTTYQIGSNRLRFTTDGGPLAPGKYEFRASGAGLTDPFGTKLDGNGDTTGGDDFVHVFSVSTPTNAHNVTITTGQFLTDIDFGNAKTNSPPTDISLDKTTLAENAGVNATVGTLSGVDPDPASKLTFSLPNGVDDNAAFNISGTLLRANASFDYETDSSYTVTVRVTDQGGLSYDEQFVITVTDVNEAP
ncbi:MAG: S8 family serine peptidase, partial [Planctomycetaceae bacterium]|nr:S8 family serine peptidase [Planctomycetaceae bacterium]